ncbi:hypothetical protein GCM10022403_091380 [Streptomyces coacervatus]|uniref:DUF1275 domain-containing protein n=1 Tax=Streptomyces coacervatus TaxID=647381 RepID=A0ABP7JHF6_9ACTN|nr:DUF1275 family protein [Streptomyces coacervatus]MDF2272568.1 DUF1275 family protein [Streptomyces coacervatus]
MAADAAGFSLAASLAALVSFAVGALLGGRLAHRARAHRGRVLYLALLLETALCLAAYVIAEAAATPYPGSARYTLIALLGLAMGVQNAAARALAVPDLTTTVLTLTITGVAADSRAAGGKGGKAGRRTLSAAAMFTGGLAGVHADALRRRLDCRHHDHRPAHSHPRPPAHLSARPCRRGAGRNGRDTTHQRRPREHAMAAASLTARHAVWEWAGQRPFAAGSRIATHST